MKKIMCLVMTALVLLSLLVACSAANDVKESTESAVAEVPMGKVAINIEGTVTEVDGDKITLDNGMVIVITEDTLFAGDPDTGNTISQDIAVGNYIQGFTSGDLEAAEVNADNIYTNLIFE